MEPEAGEVEPELRLVPRDADAEAVDVVHRPPTVGDGRLILGRLDLAGRGDAEVVAERRVLGRA